MFNVNKFCAVKIQLFSLSPIIFPKKVEKNFQNPYLCTQH